MVAPYISVPNNDDYAKALTVEKSEASFFLFSLALRRMHIDRSSPRDAIRLELNNLMDFGRKQGARAFFRVANYFVETALAGRNNLEDLFYQRPQLMLPAPRPEPKVPS